MGGHKGSQVGGGKKDIEYLSQGGQEEMIKKKRLMVSHGGTCRAGEVRWPEGKPL